MFGQDAAACCDVTSKQGLTAASLPVASPAVGGRTIAFPMKDPYSPASNALVPVSGLNAWPYRKRLGRTFYGLNGLRGARGFSGMGEGPPPFYDPTLDPIYVSGGDPNQYPVGQTPPIFSSQGVALPGSSGPSLLQQIQNLLGSILPAVPAIVSSAEGNPYYNPAQLGQQRQTVAGVPVQTAGLTSGSTAQVGATLGASVGNIFNSLASFVVTNPLLVLGGGAAVLLLMREPPRRR